VNPASGCLPMLLTMPVLFAFYSLLSVAIEIRGAPFIWWIRDLSVHDPLFVTPILMGVTMVVQQRMTPTAGDPMQQKMMMIMPVVFLVMFLWAPSGLVLYWLMSNLWGIGQQVVTNRLIGPPRIRTVRPPAERRLKRAGAGKTAQAEQQNPAKD
jgi:YidC/Oxa1 family membrane protein insertase